MDENNNDILKKLAARRPLFWDIDEKDIPNALVKCDEWVLVRVLQYGTLNDIDLVIAFYGEQRARKVLAAIDMPDVAYAMAHLYLGIDKRKKYAL